MKTKTLSALALAALLVGCGGGGGGSKSGSGSGGSGSGGTGASYASTFTITATEDLTGAGIDPDGHAVAVVAQSPSDGVVSSLQYFPASAGKSITFPAGYTLEYVDEVSGHFAIFEAKDASGTEGLLILNVDKNTSTFEAGRDIQATDGDRIMTSTFGTDGNTDFKIETFSSSSASVTSTKSVALPTGVNVQALAGDYLLVNNVQVRAHGRAAHKSRLAKRDNGDFSLYSTSGTKLVDYAGSTGATLKAVLNINASGQAVGTEDTTTGTVGVSWDKSGKATILPGGGLNVRPYSITDGGRIVGIYAPSTTDPTQNVAVSFSGGKETTLTALGSGFPIAGITRNGAGIVTASYDDDADTTTLSAYTVK